VSEDSPDKSPPIDYQSPGAPDAGRSQWITDDHAMSKWLVGCALIITGIGAVIAAIVTVLSLAVGC
jgi:hypothetical protein